LLSTLAHFSIPSFFYVWIFWLAATLVLLSNPEFQGISLYVISILEALTIGVLISLSFSIIFTGLKNFYPSENDHVLIKSAGIAQSAQSVYLPGDVYHQVAIHEAGHLLSLGLYETLPDTIEVFINSHYSNPTGNVSYRYKNAYSSSFVSRLAEMKFSLAGISAELAVLNKEKLGSRSDYSGWEQKAREVLDEGYGIKPWFIHPSNKAEALINAKTLKAMRSEQIDYMMEFMKENSELILEIAEVLKTEGRCATEIVLPFISRAKLLSVPSLKHRT